jgi:tetratricopeptide (TPR) repeat protein
MDAVAHSGGDPDELFARAQELATAFRHAEAEPLLHEVLARLDGGRSAGGLTRERLQVTLAVTRAELGHVDEGLRILDRLVPEATGQLLGLVLSQRGLLHLRAGRVAEALHDIDAAVPLQPPGSADLAVNLLNRGWLHLSTGALQAARRDLEECARVAGPAGRPVLAARARHNLGYLSFLGGDLPTALAEMDAAHAQNLALTTPGESPDPQPVYHLDRARVLFVAGLLAEAEAGLVEAADGFARLGSLQDQAECELSRAQVALSLGRADDAVTLAERARSGFAHRGSTAWTHVAELLVLRARQERGGESRQVVTAAARLADQLAADGLAEDARTARLLAVQAQLRAAPASGPEHGQDSGAPSGPGSGHRAGPVVPPLHRDDGILTRLYCRQVRAAVAEAAGRRREAGRELRAGLRELHRHQSSFGSLDLQTAVTRHGVGLAARGLEAALAEGSPAAVLAWSEHGRALASRLPPVRPPDDIEAARLLEQLRYVRTELRALQLRGQDDPWLRGRRSELERRIRQRSWYAPGPGDVTEPVTTPVVRRALAEEAMGDAGVMVVHLVSGERLHALVIRPGGSRLIDLGRAGDLWEGVRRVRADLDVLALRGVVPQMRATVLRSLGHGLDRLAARLWEPVAATAGGGPVVLVPSGALTAVPWPMLPGLRGRPVTVARSATTWWRTLRRTPAAVTTNVAAAATAGGTPSAGTPVGRERVVLAAGPDLDRADDEVRQAARGWDRATVLTGDDATGPAVLSAMADAEVVHLAAHGVHEAANPLFSAVRLADGPLFGYDLSLARRLPDQVVLSACDLGLATERPGDELLGMTAVLLHGGARCVVAAVARVSDEVAREVTVGYHAGLRQGLVPAQALARATRDRLDAPFVCFGNGW